MNKFLKTTLLVSMVATLLMLSGCGKQLNGKLNDLFSQPKLTIHGNTVKMNRTIGKTLTALNLELLSGSNSYNDVLYTSLDDSIGIDWATKPALVTVTMYVFAADKNDHNKVIVFLARPNMSFKTLEKSVVFAFRTVSGWESGDISFTGGLSIGQTRSEVLASCGEPRQKGVDADGNYVYQYGHVTSDDTLFSMKLFGVKTNYIAGTGGTNRLVNVIFDGEGEDARVVNLFYRDAAM